MTAQQLIAQLGMRPLPSEGTMFTPVYRGAGCSSMLGLYCEAPAGPPSRSVFHRLPVDEVWYHQGGDALRLVLLHPNGCSEEVILGPNPAAGQRLQHVVPARTWQAGHWLGGGPCGWSLFGCAVAPAFDVTMFEGGTLERLLAGWPQCADDIQLLACASGCTQMPGEAES
jgi:predicted cupin superfamily sugar epimerase